LQRSQNKTTKHQTFEPEDFSADNLYIKDNNNLEVNNVNEQILADMNLDSYINIDQPQIKTEIVEKEPIEDTLKELNNSSMENHTIDSNMIVDPLTTLYDNSKVAKSSFISNDDNKYQLVVSKKKHKGKAKVLNAKRNKVMSLDSKKNPGLRTKRS
ncbi:23090_t:CDS:1, partial [Cetraspora pellucida]